MGSMHTAHHHPHLHLIITLELGKIQFQVLGPEHLRVRLEAQITLSGLHKLAIQITELLYKVSSKTLILYLLPAISLAQLD